MRARVAHPTRSHAYNRTYGVAFIFFLRGRCRLFLFRINSSFNNLDCLVSSACTPPLVLATPCDGVCRLRASFRFSRPSGRLLSVSIDNGEWRLVPCPPSYAENCLTPVGRLLPHKLRQYLCTGSSLPLPVVDCRLDVDDTRVSRA